MGTALNKLVEAQLVAQLTGHAAGATVRGWQDYSQDTVSPACVVRCDPGVPEPGEAGGPYYNVRAAVFALTSADSDASRATEAAILGAIETEAATWLATPGDLTAAGYTCHGVVRSGVAELAIDGTPIRGQGIELDIHVQQT